MASASTYWLLLLVLGSSSARIEKVDGSNLIASRIDKSGGHNVTGISSLDERRKNIEWSDRSQHKLRSSFDDISLKIDSFSPVQRQRRATSLDELCRTADGHYLPIDLFALDTCARCYRYIPDHPSFFYPRNKWNHTVITVRTETLGVTFNVTYLIHHRENVTVSSIFVLHNFQLNSSASDQIK